MTRNIPDALVIQSRKVDGLSPQPLSIINAGSGGEGVGLQNNQSMLRYELASEVLRMIPHVITSVTVNT